MSFIFSVIRKSVWLLFSALFALSGLFSSPATVKYGSLKPENEFEYLYSDGAAFCQGIATDGDADRVLFSNNGGGEERVSFQNDDEDESITDGCVFEIIKEQGLKAYTSYK